MIPKIRFIVHTVSSERDRNGNRYHYARVTSTMTGRALIFQSDGQSNALSLVRRALRDVGVDDTWPIIHDVESVIPKSQWKEASKAAQLYEHQVTSRMILTLDSE